MKSRFGLILGLVLAVVLSACLLQVSIHVRQRQFVPAFEGLAAESPPVVVIQRHGADLHARITITEVYPVASYTINRFTLDGKLPDAPRIPYHIGSVAHSSSVEFVFRSIPQRTLVHHWKLDRAATWQSGASVNSSMEGAVSEGLYSSPPSGANSLGIVALSGTGFVVLPRLQRRNAL